MIIAFLKGEGFVSNLIKWWTESNYCHCEFLFSDGLRFGCDPMSPFTTRLTKETPSSVYWDYVSIPMTIEEEFKIREFCMNEVGCKYDWKGIFLSQILPLGYENKEKWFCSELCTAGLQQVGLLKDKKANRISPGALFKLIKT
jgi:hypothetical protein